MSSEDELSSEEHKNVPLKKRKAQQKQSSSSDDEDFVDEYDADLYKDDEDRIRLAGLSEMEREQILNERYEKRKAAQERLALKRKLRTQKKGGSLPAETSSSGRQTRARATPLSRSKKAFEHYKAKRKEKASREAKKKREVFSSSGSDDEDEDEDESYTESEQRENGGAKMDAQQPAEEGEIAERGELPTLEDMNSLRLSRNTLEKWVDQPFFERLVVGFFVRVLIGMNKDNRMVYRLAQVQAVTEAARPYHLGKKETYKQLSMKHAGNEKSFRMEFVSNQPFTETEYAKWMTSMAKSKLPIITRQEVQAKRETLSLADNYVFTEEDVRRMVEEKQKLKAKPLSISKQKAQLQAQIEAAKDAANIERKKELKKEKRQLIELENEENARMLSWHQGSKVSLADINKKNKARNMEKVVEKKQQTESSETDPFSRRPTKPSIVMKKEPSEGSNGNAKAEKEKEKESTKASKGGTAEKEKEQDVEEVSMVDNLITKAHDELNLEIDIDLLAAQKSRPPKPVPTPAPVADRKRPAPPPTQKKTLSVEDYKRRRGLF